LEKDWLLIDWREPIIEVRLLSKRGEGEGEKEEVRIDAAVVFAIWDKHWNDLDCFLECTGMALIASWSANLIQSTSWGSLLSITA